MEFAPIVPVNTLGQIDRRLLLKSEQICLKSASLIGGYSGTVIDAIKDLLRYINSYYSNRIESEGTHPINIEKASKKDFSSNPIEKKLQYLSLAHIETQQQIELLLSRNKEQSPYSTDFIQWVHEQFYTKDGMSDFLNIESESESIIMTPGEFRKHYVQIGQHIPIEPQYIDSSMLSFEKAYGSSIGLLMSHQLIYALSSHHRLTWIHPFLDGNGRTSRLTLDAALFSIGVPGYGLWNISRGLARNLDGYRGSLRSADVIRQGDYDGRGPLSTRGLMTYIDFMLDCALDQIEYMSGCLRIDMLSERIQKYVALSQAKLFDIEPLPNHSEKIFNYLLNHGESSRGAMFQAIGISERTGRRVLSELLKREYAVSSSPKSPVKLKFNVHMSSRLFPDLFPESY